MRHAGESDSAGQCTPVNIFNLADPAQVTALGTISSGYDTDRIYTSKQASFAVDGKMFAMPAGDALVSIQADYTELRGDFDVDFLITATPPLYLNCFLAQETCTGPNSGGYDVSELYSRSLPAVGEGPAGRAGAERDAGYALLRVLDVRQHDELDQFKLEYRPIEDILLSGSFAEVFRAPTILDLYAWRRRNNSPTFTDPCVGLTTARRRGQSEPGAGLRRRADSTARFAQPNGQVTGLLLGNSGTRAGDRRRHDVRHHVRRRASLNDNFSIRVDYWHYQIDDVITQLDTNFSINQCVQTGDPTFCDLMSRFRTRNNAGMSTCSGSRP